MQDLKPTSLGSKIPGFVELLEQVTEETADFSVGFVLLSKQDDVWDAYPAGSGALVAVGSTHGILTAAHVLEKLPNQGEVGIVRFPRSKSSAQKLAINMEMAEKLMIGAKNIGPEGPDLGFLRLPPDDVMTFQARNVFFNLEKRRKSVLSDDEPGPPYFDGISGTVAEWTTDLPAEHGFSRTKGFQAMLGIGLVEREHEVNDFDLLDFEVTYERTTTTPDSLGGMSGGALWRFYCTKSNDGQLTLSDKKIFGVAFYESDKVDRKRIITCHGPKSIYGTMIDAIREK